MYASVYVCVRTPSVDLDIVPETDTLTYPAYIDRRRIRGKGKRKRGEGAGSFLP